MRAKAWWVIVVLIAGVAASGVSRSTLLTGEASARQDTQPPPVLRLLDKPGQWVPFSATMTRVLDPGRVLYGKFYRSSDGSTRSESGPLAGVVDVIGIKNMAQKTFYLWVETTGWTSHPMELPGGRYFPPPTRMPPDSVVTEKQVDGFRLIKRPTDSNGFTDYLAPELNYYAVETMMPCNDTTQTGCGLWLSEISVGEQPLDLFTPPTG